MWIHILAFAVRFIFRYAIYKRTCLNYSMQVCCINCIKLNRSKNIWTDRIYSLTKIGFKEIQHANLKPTTKPILNGYLSILLYSILKTIIILSFSN